MTAQRKTPAVRAALLAVMVGCAPARAAELAAAEPARAVQLARTTQVDVKSADGTAYVLSVALPRDYATSTERYAVVYLLDAAYAFPIVKSVVDHLTDRGDLPPLLLVGVGYPGGIEGNGWLRRYRLQRTRDDTPTRSPVGYPDGVQDVSGGADAFLVFLKSTALPLIDARFRTKPGDRALVGHSYGGLFATYAALRAPDVFTRVVAVSPSLWYDHRFIFAEEQRTRSATRALPLLFLAAGSAENNKSDGNIAGSIGEFRDALVATGVPPAQVTAVLFDGETHNTVYPAAVTRGLRALFAPGVMAR